MVNLGEIDLGRVIRHMLLLDASLNGVMWSIQLELLAMPLVLIGALLDRRYGVRALVAITGILFVLCFVRFWYSAFAPVLSIAPMLCFGLGMVLRHAGAVVRRLDS